MSGFPDKGADLRESPGNFRGSLGNFRGSPGNFRGTPGLLLSSTVREPPGKSPKNFRGKFGELPGKSGDFPEARGSLTPSQRLAKFVSNITQNLSPDELSSLSGKDIALILVHVLIILFFPCSEAGGRRSPMRGRGIAL